ncbi:MAG: hypothetical protein JNL87_09530 [Burkholderiaceae bacterium]|nr:hypothetical protein [Burkholderiaceae bacterium]
MLWLTTPGLDPGEVRTIGVDLVVNGSDGRAPGQDRGQAGQWFKACSGLNTYALTDQVAG